MKHSRLLALAAIGGAAAVLVACKSAPPAPLPTKAQVDLPRFMGDWYVIGSIPTYFERGAHGAVESYKLAADGTVDIDFRYRKDSFDGEQKHMGSRGFVQDGDPAVWGVQFIWPIKADYRVAYLSADYSQTIIAREKRDYVWIMARTPAISESDYQALLQRVAALGYDTGKVVRVPQRS